MGTVRTLILSGGGWRGAFHAGVYKCRQIKVTIIAPEDFYPAARILDYDRWIEHLILQGYQAAARAFRQDYPEGEHG